MDGMMMPRPNDALYRHARLHGLMATTSTEQMPKVAAWNVSELEARARRRKDQHRAALDVAHSTTRPNTRHINLRIAAGERLAYGTAIEALRFWREVMRDVGVDAALRRFGA